MAGLIPKDPTVPATLAEMNQRLTAVIDLLNNSRVPIRGVTVGTTVTRIAHGQRSIPLWVTFYAKEAITVCQPQPPDAQFVYLQAAAEVEVDLELVVL